MAEQSNITIANIIDQWLEITVDKLHNALDDYEIGKLDGRLWRSIVGEVIRTGSEPEKVIVKFLQYGRFVDMGVGRGVPIGSKGSKAFAKSRNENGTLRNYGRKVKPWYSKVKFREVSRLREILAANLATQSIGEIENILSKGIQIKL